MDISAIEVFGITTFILLSVTALFGTRVLKIEAKMRRKTHIILAVITICAAAAHAGIVLYSKFIL